MAVRMKPVAPQSRRMTLVTLHQTDPSGRYELEQSLWNVNGERAHKILSDCELQGDKRWPKALLDEFSTMRKQCEQPDESYDNKLIGKHYQITLSHLNDTIINESTSDSGANDESDSIEERAVQSDASEENADSDADA